MYQLLNVMININHRRFLFALSDDKKSHPDHQQGFVTAKLADDSGHEKSSARAGAFIFPFDTCFGGGKYFSLKLNQLGKGKNTK